ncbi:phosphatase PAP2 family protein [Allorhizobium sp. BGMRC 0089]|uniref:phosphatase PAP2 family protein n=1 Tax=Allorhizobium sonneratiae TaxID=2934936 RepID=UPI002033AD23|nr:phosphatase PAP2 family protein [Allorhizobium sonneratiae]MCM2294378.1 phosphatase PAP2 family protein [Allorhizobium sonneratiae]
MMFIDRLQKQIAAIVTHVSDFHRRRNPGRLIKRVDWPKLFRKRHPVKVVGESYPLTFLFVVASMVLLSAVVFDQPVGKAGPVANPVIQHFAQICTRFGKADWCLILSFLFGMSGLAVAYRAETVMARGRALFMAWFGLYLFASIALSGLAANLLKRLIGRGRPYVFAEHGAFHFQPLAGSSLYESFPSGHSTTFGAIFMMAALVFPRYRLALLVGALWMGMSRVMVGAHFPGDVIAGLGFGAWFSLMLALVFARAGYVFRAVDGGWPVLRQRLIRRR